MKRLLFVTVLMILLSGLAVAGDFPRFEVFGGYSAQRLGITDEDLNWITAGMEDDLEDICPGCDSSVSNNRYLKKGFEGSFAVNVNSFFGIVGDVRYGFDDIVTGNVTNNDDINVQSAIKYTDLAVLGGPRFSFRQSERVTPFVHALFGMDYGKVNYELTGTTEDSGEETSTGFGISVGGGFDVNVGDTIAIRLAQVDYYLTRHNEEFLKNVDFAAGIVFRFGW